MSENTKRLEELYNQLGYKKPFKELTIGQIEHLKTISYFASMCEHFDLFVKKEDNNDGN